MKINLAPDSHRYLTAGRGVSVSAPFNRRPLLPWLCGPHVWRWQVLSYSSLACLFVLVGLLVHRAVGSLHAAVFASAMMAALPQVRFWIQTPVLVDQFSIATALLAALLPWPYNLIVACISGLSRETAPIFAALYAWNPILLLGLIPVGLWSVVAPKGPDPLGREEWHRNPLQTSLRFHAGKWRNLYHMILPWGGCVFALCFPSIQMLVVVLAAYAQMLVATDSARLFVWAAPIVILQLAHVDPTWMALLVLVTLFNPWAGEGA